MQCSSVSHAAASVSGTSENQSVQPPIFNQPDLSSEILQTLFQVQDIHALQGLPNSKISYGVTLYPLYPAEAGRPWTVDLFDISQTLSVKNEKFDVLFITEGKATISIDSYKKELLPGHSVQIFPGSSYSLDPGCNGCRFVSLHIPGSASDVTEHAVPLDIKYFQERDLQGKNTANDLISAKTVGGRYNVAIMDIVGVKRHYHKHSAEDCVVLSGTLLAEIGNDVHTLPIGQKCRVSPMEAHKFTSANPPSPARFLSIKIPGYDPSDVFMLE